MSGKTKLILIALFFLVLLGTGLSWGAASTEVITAASDAAQPTATTQDKTATAANGSSDYSAIVRFRDLGSLLHLKVLLLALALTAAAVLGKLAASLAVRGLDRLLVGIGMIPRVEVTLIVGNIGLAIGVLNRDLFSAIILVVLFTVLLTPPLLKWAIERTGALKD